MKNSDVNMFFIHMYKFNNSCPPPSTIQNSVILIFKLYFIHSGHVLYKKDFSHLSKVLIVRDYSNFIIA